MIQVEEHMGRITGDTLLRRYSEFNYIDETVSVHENKLFSHTLTGKTHPFIKTHIQCHEKITQDHKPAQTNPHKQTRTNPTQTNKQTHTNSHKQPTRANKPTRAITAVLT